MADVVDVLARAGLAVRGAVYAIVAFLALEVAWGNADHAPDQQGALRAVAGTGIGGVVLVALAAGFAAYALWRLSQAIAPTSSGSGSGRRALRRTGHAASALLYGALAVGAVRLVLGDGNGSPTGHGTAQQRQQAWTARVLDWGAGPALVVAAGVLVVVAGGYLVWRGTTSRPDPAVSVTAAPGRAGVVVRRLGAAGSIARGVVVGLVGIFLVQAALEHDPGDTAGFDGALRRLVDAPYGPAVLTLVALGLAAFGVFSLASARWGVVERRPVTRSSRRAPFDGPAPARGARSRPSPAPASPSATTR